MFENPFGSSAYLIIDDFADMRAMIKGLLYTLGASDIDSARDGGSAIDLMKQKRYDVVLCDYNLGRGKDGQQVLEEARHRKLIGVASVFIMITAENTRDMVMGAVEYEPDSYLSKPFSKELLRTRLQKLLQRKSELAPVNYALEKQRFNDALRLLDTGIQKKPKNLADLVKLKAEICFDAGKLDMATEVYEEVLAKRDIPWARLGIGKVHFANKRYSEAAEAFQHLVTHFPTLTAAYDWLAKTQRTLGKLDSAQKTLEKAIELSPKAIRRQQALGELALHNKDTALAERSLEKAVQLGRHSVYNHPSMYAGLARAKTACGKHDDATAVVEKMNTTFEHDAEATFYALVADAEIKQNRGETGAAAASLEAAERACADIAGGRSAQLSLELARTASHLGQTEKSAEILQAAIRNNHDETEFLAEATEAYRAIGTHDDAEDAVQKIRQEIVDMNNRGVRLLEEGLYDDAIALFEQAADGMTTNRVINLNAARAHILKMERYGSNTETIGKVRAYVERVKQFAPNDNGLAQVTERYQRLALKGNTDQL